MKHYTSKLLRLGKEGDVLYIANDDLAIHSVVCRIEGLKITTKRLAAIARKPDERGIREITEVTILEAATPVKKQRKAHRCSHCKRLGHNAQTCRRYREWMGYQIKAQQ